MRHVLCFLNIIYCIQKSYFIKTFKICRRHTAYKLFHWFYIEDGKQSTTSSNIKYIVVQKRTTNVIRMLASFSDRHCSHCILFETYFPRFFCCCRISFNYLEFLWNFILFLTKRNEASKQWKESIKWNWHHEQMAIFTVSFRCPVSSKKSILFVVAYFCPKTRKRLSTNLLLFLIIVSY